MCYKVFNMDNIVNKLKLCRTRKGWTQEQLARQMGVTLNTVQRWESAKTYPSPLAMDKLSVLFKEVLDHDQIKLI
jgi:putative transcriptional regulator